MLLVFASHIAVHLSFQKINYEHFLQPQFYYVLIYLRSLIVIMHIIMVDLSLMIRTVTTQLQLLLLMLIIFHSRRLIMLV